MITFNLTLYSTNYILSLFEIDLIIFILLTVEIPILLISSNNNVLLISLAEPPLLRLVADGFGLFLLRGLAVVDLRLTTLFFEDFLLFPNPPDFIILENFALALSCAALGFFLDFAN